MTEMAEILAGATLCSEERGWNIAPAEISCRGAVGGRGCAGLDLPNLSLCLHAGIKEKLCCNATEQKSGW